MRKLSIASTLLPLALLSMAIAADKGQVGARKLPKKTHAEVSVKHPPRKHANLHGFRR